MHDPLDIRDLVHDELTQRRESGYDVTELSAAHALTAPDDIHALERIYDALMQTSMLDNWAYQEPDDLPGIIDAMPSVENSRSGASHSEAELHNRILGGWLGRIAGCNLGKPMKTVTTGPPPVSGTTSNSRKPTR
jgi:hypothetical protein